MVPLSYSLASNDPDLLNVGRDPEPGILVGVEMQSSSSYCGSPAKMRRFAAAVVRSPSTSCGLKSVCGVDRVASVLCSKVPTPERNELGNEFGVIESVSPPAILSC